MKPLASNQRGFSLLSLLITMSIMMILGYLLLSNTGVIGGGGKGARSKKEKAMGAQCMTTMSALGMTVQTRLASEQPVETMDDLLKDQPGLESTIYNDSLWVEDGYPTLEYTGDTTFTITGNCVDGITYTYDSSQGSVESEQWR